MKLHVFILKFWGIEAVVLTENYSDYKHSFLQSFWLGWVVGSWPLFWALFISFVLGTAYSINVSLLAPL